MNLIIYLVSCWVMLTLAGVAYLYVQATRIPETITIKPLLPRIDLLHQIVFLSLGLEYWKNESYQTAYDNCIKHIGRAMAEYPDADWDTWWALTYQVLDVYQYKNG
jgi:hypothetical protein